LGRKRELRLLKVSGGSGYAVRALKDRILQDGRNLGRGILKVDSFLNHQVDAALVDACGRELATRLRHVAATKVLTAEISGIAPAVTTALHLQVPLVYARRSRPVTMPDQVLLTVAPSHTRGQLVELIVSPEYLQPGERVLIIDDFLATGQTILGLARLVQAGGARVVGVGTVIEKSFEHGREALIPLGVPVESLAIVTDMRDGQIVLA
jgi:xanthine phosphoribosyltransferase